MNALRTLSIVAAVATGLALAGCPPAPGSSPPRSEATGAGTMHDQGTAGQGAGQGTMHDRGSGTGQGMMNGQGSTGPSGAGMAHGQPKPADAR